MKTLIIFLAIGLLFYLSTTYSVEVSNFILNFIDSLQSGDTETVSEYIDYTFEAQDTLNELTEDLTITDTVKFFAASFGTAFLGIFAFGYGQAE